MTLGQARARAQQLANRNKVTTYIVVDSDQPGGYFVADENDFCGYYQDLKPAEILAEISPKN